MITTQTHHESKRKLLDAALHVIRSKGYTATRVEDVCVAAGLTKGSFFHHFKSKEELALAAAEYWSLVTGQLFRGAAYHAPADPVDRLLAYVDFRKALLKGELAEFTCLVGTMVQEVYETHPQLREACEASIWGHAATLEPDIAEAMRMYGVRGEWTARSLALHAQAVIQGSFILAKAHGGPEVAAESIEHLRWYIAGLFGAGSKAGSREQGAGSRKLEAGSTERAQNEQEASETESEKPKQPQEEIAMTATAEKTLNLTTTPETVEWPETHYVFIEKVGPFQTNAPQAWNQMHPLVPEITKNNQVTGYMSLYDMEKGIYRAGVSIAAEPKNLPAGVDYEKFPGGKYAKFVLTGPFSQLGPATGRACELVRELKLPLRESFNIENYVDDPRTTPEDQLRTEILFPVQ